ncbi:hypothetical protein EU642_22060 [Salmonella enterica]|nr:hypothetical protein [Salmonella enterica]EAO0118539.1 hypothetical protein [Salmonella enterica]EAO3601643.1 hypothetical protein [Salmonella enterica]EAR6391537.1 hypothetical protein [Salmonella enterica]EAV1285301.1 hypothetical protein [Salmonella enterica]
MRLAQPTDFFETLEGIGRFRFARRKMADEMQIQRLFAEYTGGVEPTAWLLTLGEYLSTLRVLTVQAPDGWDIDDMDPLDPETYSQIGRVFVALREREETFRRKPGAVGQGQGAQDAGHGGSLVSPDLQTAAEPPALP